MSIDAALGRLGIQTGVCTSSTRPANPYEGQVIYETDTNNLRFWSGSAWESNKGAVISSAAPPSPAAGDIWYDSDDGRAYVYYDDGSSQQWVEFGAPPSGSTIALASYADSAARTTAIPSPTEADLSYLQDTNSVEVYDGSAWAAVGYGGLVHISRTTIGSAVSSVTVSGAFSATYDNYRIIVRGVVLSINENVGIQLSGLTSGYKFGGLTATYAPALSANGTASGNKMRFGAVADSAGNIGGMVADVYGPNLASPTSSTSLTHYGHPSVGGLNVYGAVETSSTQHTDFTFLPDSGTMTGGTIDVYGYAKA